MASTYVVFAVDNADRLTLMGSPTPQGPEMKQIAISFIEAPRLARRMQDGSFTEEDPYAYEAMEFIRSSCVGKQVRFRDDYHIEPLQRTAGELTLPDGTSAAKILLSKGLATLPKHLPPQMPKALFDEYHKIMETAENGKRGVFSPDAPNHVRKLVNLSTEEISKLAQSLKGQQHQVRIERVLSPAIYVVSGGPLKNVQLALHLPGITAKDIPDDIVAEGKFHTERYLLHRNVDILFEGHDIFGNPLGSVTSKRGTFQEELLSKGLVKVNQGTLAFTTRGIAMRAAEADAQKKRLKLWKDYEPATAAAVTQIVGESGPVAVDAPVPTGIPIITTEGVSKDTYKGEADFQGTVVQIVSGDTIVVRHDNSLEYSRLALAGVRVSRNVERDHDGKSPEVRVKYNEFTWEAKEHLRTKYIGARVSVAIEYARVVPVSNEIRPCATVVSVKENTNLAADLLELGYATFFLGRNDVCSNAGLLQAAENVAKAAKRGVHGKKQALPTTVVELNRLGDARGKYYLSFLHRGMQGNRPPTWRGVVDLVLGGGSLRVYIPKEHFQIPVKVAGIIAPAGDIGNDVADPYSAESKDFGIVKLQQREVDVQVFSSDRPGNFLCKIMTLDGVNYAEALVAEGLATVGNGDRLPFYQQLLTAEAAAQAAKKNIWSNEGTLPQRAVKAAAARAESGNGGYSLASGEEAVYSQYVFVEVGTDGASVYLHKTGEAATKIRGQIQAVVSQTVSLSKEYRPKRGELVAVQYHEDKSWNRGRVQRVRADDDTAEVAFIDFGSSSEVHIREMRAIPRGSQFDLLRDTPPLAILAPLAFLKAKLPNAAAIEAATNCMYDYTEGNVIAKVAYTNSSGKKFYSITVDKNAASLSETLLQRGLALIDKHSRVVDEEEYKRHERAQEVARRGHKALWQFGDVDDDSDDE